MQATIDSVRRHRRAQSITFTPIRPLDEDPIQREATVRSQHHDVMPDPCPPGGDQERALTQPSQSPGPASRRVSNMLESSTKAELAEATTETPSVSLQVDHPSQDVSMRPESSHVLQTSRTDDMSDSSVKIYLSSDSGTALLVVALIDLGADDCFVSSRLCEELGAEINTKHARSFRNLGGTFKTVGTVKLRASWEEVNVMSESPVAKFHVVTTWTPDEFDVLLTPRVTQQLHLDRNKSEKMSPFVELSGVADEVFFSQAFTNLLAMDPEHFLARAITEFWTAMETVEESDGSSGPVAQWNTDPPRYTRSEARS